MITFSPTSKFIERIKESSKLPCTSFETQPQSGAETSIKKLITVVSRIIVMFFLEKQGPSNRQHGTFSNMSFFSPLLAAHMAYGCSGFPTRYSRHDVRTGFKVHFTLFITEPFKTHLQLTKKTTQ